MALLRRVERPGPAACQERGCGLRASRQLTGFAWEEARRPVVAVCLRHVDRWEKRWGQVVMVPINVERPRPGLRRHRK